MNDILESLYNRKSTRVFTGEHIPESDVETILNASFQAPTAGNQQLYTILRITDPELRHTVAELCDHQPFIERADLVLIYLADCKRYLDIYHAANVQNVRDPGAGDLILAMMDACIAAQNAVVAAESLGIGSCYIGDVIENAEAMRTALQLPAYVMPACMLVFGYPTDQQWDRVKPNRFRKEALVFENVYRERTPEEIREDFTIRADRDGYDFEKDTQAFCARKYTSDFSLEMTRSAEVYLQEFLGCESIMREARTNDMQQLLLMVTYTAQPGTREQFVNEVTASGVLDIIRHEDGCLGYAYYYDAENADKVILIEQWQSQEQQQIHMTQPHMTQLMTIKDQYIVDTKVQKGLC